jgi:hypothetical protein
VLRSLLLLSCIGFCLAGCGREQAEDPEPPAPRAASPGKRRAKTEKARVATSPVLANPWPGILPLTVKADLGRRANDDDLRCLASGRYWGNFISPIFALVITEPSRGQWEYACANSYSGTYDPPSVYRAVGTYKASDGFAIFTGRYESHPGQMGGEKQAGHLRLGVNYGFSRGVVEFNRFFRRPKGRLTYARKWFRRTGTKWSLLEERTLSIPGTMPQGKVWKIHMKGQRIRWDKQGAKSRQSFDQVLSYKRQGRGVAVSYHLEEQVADWIPPTLIPGIVDGRLEFVGLGMGGYIVLRGFNPELAKPPRAH